MTKIESRKLIKFGNSSHIISLPKEWLKKNKLNKGDIVYICENGNNELVLNSFKREEKKQKKNIVIDIHKKDILRIKRELVSAYLNGYNHTKIIGDNISQHLDDIKNFVNELIGFETTEQTEKSVVIQDFLNLDDISMKETLRKMDISTRLIFSELKNIHNPNSYKRLMGYEGDINKHLFLLIRFVREMLNDPSILKSLNLNQIEVLKYWQISHNIERVADKLKYLAANISEIDKNNKILVDIFNIFSEIESYYLDVMKVYYSDDIELAYKLSNTRDSIYKICDRLYKKHKNNSGSSETFFWLKQIVSSIHNIVRRIYS